MRLLLLAAAVAALWTENLALPAGKDGQREDVVTRCLVEVLSKALSKPDSQPLDQECKDILNAGVKHALLDKKSAEGAVAHEEGVKGQTEEPEAKGADVKDIEALLKTVGEKRENPEDERSQESWDLGEEKEKRYEEDEGAGREKRSNWRPGRYHQKKQKRGEEDEDNERSQESWGLEEKRSDEEGEEAEKRNWRPGRHHQHKHKRNEDGLEEERDDPEEERSQEYWDVDWKRDGHGNEDEDERSKHIWKPTQRYHHKKKLYKRGDEEDGERSQESWGLDDEREKREWRAGRHHQRRHKRDEERSEEYKEEPKQREEDREEPEEERSQEYWDVDWKRDGHGNEDEDERSKRIWKPTHRYHHKKRGDEEDGERSQESWGLDDEREKREWRAGRFHQRRHKRDEERSEEEREEPDEERSQEDWGLDKRHGKEEEVEKRVWKPTHRYHRKKKYHKRGRGSSEEEEQRSDSEEDEDAGRDRDEVLRFLAEKRNPWIFRGYYHPAWYKRNPEDHTSDKMEELAKLLKYKINQLSNHSNQEEKRSVSQRALDPQEEKELENLAAMDTELQKIASKLHVNSK
ncbi:hypothetical protein LDENG_00086370 [Lucifuga dentata]|nr:hypothetical protein LDENG_00086370 [Lucifuga dentata]